MTALEQITELEGKVIASQNLIKEYENSNNASDGWIAYAKANCTVDPMPYINGTNPLSGLSLSTTECRTGVNKAIYNNKRIKEEQANITLWKDQIEQLKKDPAVVIAVTNAISDATAANNRKKIITWSIVGIVFIVLVIFLIRKYKQ